MDRYRRSSDGGHDRLWRGAWAPLLPAIHKKHTESWRVLGIAGPRYDRNLAIAIQELERYSGAKIRLIIPMEPGGRNMPNPMSSGSRLGIPLADGDYTGRAIPEIIQIVPCIAGCKPWPATSVDPWGNVVIIRESVNPPMAERIGKHLAVAAFGTVRNGRFPDPCARGPEASCSRHSDSKPQGGQSDPPGPRGRP